MSPSTIPSTEFSTRQFNVWRDVISVVFEVERSSDVGGTSFDAAFRAFQLGDMVVADARLGEQRYVRRSAQARRDGIDHFVLNLYRVGGWRAQTARGEFQGTAGQVSVLDLSCDLVSDEPISNLVTLFVPRSLLEERLPNLAALHGSAPSGPHAVLLAEYIDLLARQLPTMPAGNEQALSRATCEMLAACLQPSPAGMEVARRGLELVLRRRALRFIDAHLDSANLSPDAVCGAVGVSRRTLYRLFDKEGGVQHCIQSRRLERIRSALTDPSESRRISEIAAEFGFVRSDHFARAFKHQFGQSAREARDLMVRSPQGQTETPTTDFEATKNFDNWIRTLNA